MVKYVSFICHVGFVTKSFFERLNALFILFELVVCQTLLVEHLGIFRVGLKSSVEVGYCALILGHVEVTLSTVLEELDIGSVFAQTNGLVILLDSLGVVSQCVVALAKAIENCWVL